MSDFIEFNLYDRFHFELSDTPYISEEEYRQDCLTLVSAYLCIALSTKKSSENSGIILDGSSLNENDILNYLENYPSGPIRIPEETLELFLRFETQTFHRLSLTENAEQYRLYRASSLLELDNFSYFCLICSLACEIDHGLASAFSLLQEDSTCTYPTIGLLRSVYGLIHPIPSFDEILFLDSDHPSFLLFDLPEKKNITLIPLILKPHVISYLTGHSYFGSSPWDTAHLIAGQNQDELLFCKEQFTSALAVFNGAAEQGNGTLLALCGPNGSGKKLTLHKIAQETGAAFMVLPLSQLELNEKNLCEIKLYALLDDYCLCLEHPDFEDPILNGKLQQLLRAMLPLYPAVVLLANKMRSTPNFPGYICRKIEYKLPEQNEAVQLWEHFSQPYSISTLVDWRTVSGKFNLTPGQIKSALQDAFIDADQNEISPDALRSAILRSGTSKLSELADRIEPFYDWDDLILADYSKQQLRNVCNRIKYKYQVEEQWGFKKKSAYGTGISVLLYGPPGTGKTMSAQVLAKELWLPLYRINLAQIISKYIGETAKNLDAIFNEAKSSNVILFFDEADALFSKRTDIQSSNDRYSNSEISYLLQKIEEFNGISILATNLANHFDEAFRRRIQYMINIHMPSEEERMILWKQAFPQDVPLDPDIDFCLLANSLEFSGSVIKSAVLQAAYYAADEGCPVGMTQIVRAVRSELTKLGKPEPHCLQIY